MSDTEPKPLPVPTPPPPPNPIRPLPDPPRNKKDRKKIRVFALVVGINNYQGDVPALGGCVKDAELVANYLQKNYGTKKQENIELTPLDPALGAASFQVEQHFKGGKRRMTLQLCVLLDEQATYDNIISAFEKHLVNNPDATGNDSFWFHFSGHGTQQFTAREFFQPQNGVGALVPDGKDQAMVCYNGGNAGNIFLADKEVGLLVEKIHENVRSKGADHKPHIVVTLDCCHSGSGTRDFMEDQLLKVRNVDLFRSIGWEEALNEANAVRTIESYYRGAFMDPVTGVAKARIPQAQHLLMAACDHVEKAGDLPEGGVFTSNLISVLNGQSDEGINYVDLFTQARARAKSQRKEQTVQLEALGGFNPYTAFLEGWALGEQQKYAISNRVITRRGQSNVIWSIRCGAINGLPTSPAEEGKIQIQIYSNSTKKCLGNGFVTKVGMQESIIQLEDGLQLQTLESQAESEQKETYFARLFTLPVAHEYLYLDDSANAAVIQQLAEQWDNESDGNLSNFNIFPLRTLDGPARPGTIIKATAGGALVVSDAADGRIWFTQPASGAQISLAKANIEKLIRWKRFLDLDNPGSKLLDEFDAELIVGDWPTYEAHGSPDPDNLQQYMATMTNVYRGKEVKIYGSEEETFFIDEDEFGDVTAYYLPHFIRFRYKIPGAKRYFYVFGMQEDGTILSFKPGFNHEIESTTENQIIDYIGESIKTFDLQPDKMEETFWFKILVTVDPIDADVLTQGPFAETREFGDARSGSSTADMWCCLTMKVKVAQQTNKIVAGSGLVSLDNDDKIRIEVPVGSPLTARASLVSATNDSRSLDPNNRLAQFEDAGLSMLGFGSDRDLKGANILELTDLPANLPAPEMEEVVSTDGQIIQRPKPLMKVSIKTATAGSAVDEDAVIVPIAFDGRHFKIVGDVAATSGSQATINIREIPNVAHNLPSGATVVSPFGETKVDRSLMKAVKMAFFKLVLKKTEQNKLCWAKVDKAGLVQQLETGVKSRVSNASRILLIMHGIIGDTTPILEAVASLLAVKPSGEDKDFLILTYDYENLNTPIEETADKLKQALQAVGLQAGHGKELTILAHSMGGLVARSFIEQKGGNEIVNHLVMAGTPNNGSPFGKIEGARSFAVRALELSANFLPNLIPFSGYLVKGLQGAAAVFNTLGQMDATSDFLKSLNEDGSDPGIRYSILAGDSTHYDAPGEGFSKFLENLQLRIGEIANSGQANDIAVAVDSIENRDVFEARHPAPAYLEDVLSCHHLNYFTNEASRQALKNLLTAE